MSRVLSAARRIAGIDLVQDICALVAMAAFMTAVTYGSAAVIMWRAGQ